LLISPARLPKHFSHPKIMIVRSMGSMQRSSFSGNKAMGVARKVRTFCEQSKARITKGFHLLAIIVRELESVLTHISDRGKCINFAFIELHAKSLAHARCFAHWIEHFRWEWFSVIPMS
jgi:hypothetical protein